MKIFNLLTVAFVALSILFFSDPALAQQQSPRVYTLFVWGTLESETRGMVELSKRKIENAFVYDNSNFANYAKQNKLFNTAGGLVDLNSYIGESITLEGERATGQNILKACGYLSEKAGPNDAVMVYIMCHGGVVKGSDGKKRHGISPVATSKNDLDMRRIGIVRGSIMRRIKSHEHRLNILITDSCSVPITSKERSAEPEYVLGKKIPYLVNFLLKARGELNINSSRPEFSTSNGESALGLGRSEWNEIPNDSENGYEERQSYESYGGSVFTNAFLKLAEEPRFTEDDLTVDRFFEKLRTELDDRFYVTWGYLVSTKQMRVAQKFFDQGGQTLTRFDDDSLPYPDDLKYESKNRFVNPTQNNETL